MLPSSLKGYLVDLFYRDKVSAAYVMEVKGKRLLVILPSGKEDSIPYSALVFYGFQGKEVTDLSAIQRLLKECHARREELKRVFNLAELWEVVKDDLKEASPLYLAELYLNRLPTPDEVCAFLRLLLEERLYFRYKSPDKVEILSGEEVQNILRQRQREKERELLRAELKTFLFELIQGEPFRAFSQKQELIITALQRFVTFEDPSVLDKDLSTVLAELNLATPQKVFELLVRRGLLQEDENLELIRFDYPKEFSKEALAQAEAILRCDPKEFAHLEVFEDLTSLETYAVDAEDTLDVDDAFSFRVEKEKSILYVHIADVSHFVPWGSPLFNGALQRSSTLYLPEEIIPMFPSPLSQGKFSLLDGELRLALTFRIELASPFEVLSFEPGPSLIKVKRRFTYEEVDRFLEEDHPFWRSLYSLLMEHKRKRYSQGAFAVILPEIQVKVLEKGEILVKRVEMTPARDLISEMMILTNHLTAKFCAEKGLPILYRRQGEPFRVFPEMENSWYYKIMQLKHLAKSELSLEPGLHSGLGLSYYTTCTSPIRRALDLIVHHQLKAYLCGREFSSKETLQALIPEIMENSRRAQTIQQKRKRYFLLKYLGNEWKAKTLEGIVVEKKERTLRLYLPEFNLMGEVRGAFPNLELGERVSTSIVRVEPRKELLLLRIL